ncbi:MAG: PQQ-binding-like beta-propeller repeat protein [Pseudomonadota bacterium]
MLQKGLATVLLFLTACTHAPLRMTSERRLGDGFFSGLSSRVVDFSHLAGADGILCFGTSGGRVYALSAADGSVRWERDLDGSVDTQPGLGSGKVFVGTSKGKFYALKSEDGGEVWHYDVPGEILGSPYVSGSTAYFAANDGVLYALDAEKGSLLWRYRRDLPDRMTIHTFAGLFEQKEVVYAAFSDGGVAALKPGTGEVIWTKDLPSMDRFSDVTALRVGDEGRVVAGQFDSTLYSLRSGGTSEWSFPNGGTSVAPISWNEDLIVPMPVNRLAQVDPRTGERKWTLDVGETARWSGLALYGRRLLAATYEGSLYVIDPVAHKVVWTYRFGAAIQGAPVVAAGKIWILTRKGRLFSLAEK